MNHRSFGSPEPSVTATLTVEHLRSIGAAQLGGDDTLRGAGSHSPLGLSLIRRGSAALLAWLLTHRWSFTLVAVELT